MQLFALEYTMCEIKLKVGPWNLILEPSSLLKRKKKMVILKNKFFPTHLLTKAFHVSETVPLSLLWGKRTIFVRNGTNRLSELKGKESTPSASPPPPFFLSSQCVFRTLFLLRNMCVWLKLVSLPKAVAFLTFFLRLPPSSCPYIFLIVAPVLNGPL